MNNVEKYMEHVYKCIKIETHEQLSIQDIASYFCIQVHYWEYPSAIASHNGKCKIFIDENISKQQQWQDFGHEMAHFFWHGGLSQIRLLAIYLNYQEDKSDYFAYHFCVPTFMLDQIKGVDVYVIMQLFNVDFDFAMRRLEMYKSKCMNRRKQNVLH